MKKLWLLCMLLIVAALPLLAQSGFKVTGTVTDKAGGQPLVGVTVSIDGASGGTVTDKQGRYALEVTDGKATLRFAYIGYETRKVKIKNRHKINVEMNPVKTQLNEAIVVGYATSKPMSMAASTSYVRSSAKGIIVQPGDQQINWNTEEYDPINENRFRSPLNHPFSTFSTDVDAASYSNMRRFINNGQMPPKDAVRVEEMINYFQYHYPQPEGKDPVAIHTEMADCPWNTDHTLVMVGLQAKTIPTDNLPPSNLVFLVDVSGSMWSPNKLPLVKSAMKLLVDQLRPQDRVAIVVYAGAAGLVLPSTPGNEKIKIKDAIDSLTAGGSTAGGAGIKLAYKTAEKNFIHDGNNRIILATDGDFNVGVSSNAEMEELVEKERNTGVYLTVLGFGMGNYKDSKMEILADKGNGNHAYIDNINEAKKIFIHEFGGTLFTVAKDVKLQVEFNPDLVEGYRLIGYENRMLKDEDFNNDKKDAGDMGSGQSVTALYEIIPAGQKSDFIEKVDKPKYQQTVVKNNISATELMTIKLRYKDPKDSTSLLIARSVTNQKASWQKASDNFRFAAGVAEFGMVLRNSAFKQGASFNQALQLAQSGLGQDTEGYRHELVSLVKNASLLQGKDLGNLIPPRKKWIMSTR